MAPRSQSQPKDATGSLSDTSRSLISLFLVLHLFCVVLACAASVSPSPLQLRLLSVLRPYCRYLGVELPYAQFNLTYGPELGGGDYRLEMLPADGDAEAPEDWSVLPDAGLRGSDRYKRFQRYAQRIAVINQFATASGLADIESAVGTMASGAAESYFHQSQITPTQLRVRLHALQSIDARNLGSQEERDPNSDTYFQVPYAANVVIDPQGNANVLKIRSEAEVARPGSGAN